MKLSEIMEDGSLGGEYPRCDDVIDHTIYLLLVHRSYAGYYYHINDDTTFLEDGLTDHDETFRDNRGWLPGANIHDAMTS